MKLNHDIYKASMENVTISDETGRKLLENAIQKNMQHKKKRRMRTTAAIAGILLVGLSMNGLCYAQTGKNVLQMFAGLFENIDSDKPFKELIAMEEGAKEFGESVIHENFRFELERYIFDKENGEVFIIMRTDSLDGTPLDMEYISKYYGLLIDGGYGGCGRQSEPAFNKDKTSAWISYFSEEEFAESENPPDEINVEIYHCIYGDSDDTAETESIGTFTLKEPTGQLKARYVDCSSLKYCDTKARITSSGFSLTFNKDIHAIIYTVDAPFHIIEITMADGTVYRIGSDRDYQWNHKIPLYDSEGNLKNKEDFTPEELEALEATLGPADEETLPDNVRSIGSYGFISDSENGHTHFSAVFNDFLNVDDIVSVHIDDVEMPLK